MDAFFRAVYLVLFFAVAIRCYENLANLSEYSGLPTQSESYRYPDLYLADKAVDGYLEEDLGGETCSITLANNLIHTAWWKFPLKRFANVAFLEIFFRKSTVNRHVGFSVFVFNDSSYTPKPSSGDRVYIQDTSTCPLPEMTINVNKVTKGIALYNSKDPPINTNCRGYEQEFATIEICEVFVMGCPFQHYGENCTVCNPRCRDQLCAAFNGSCIYGCNNSLMVSSNCSCVTGHYGTICENLCGKCVNGTHCDQNTGICPQGCEDNWQGQTCNECQDYKYGPNCTLNCGFCKNNTTCSKINGTCGNGCETGWSGALCQKLYTAEELEDHWILKIPSIITLSGSAFFVVTLVCLVVRVVCKKRKQNRTQKMQEECSRNSVSKIEKVHYVCGEPDLKGDKQSYNSSSQDYTNDNMSIYENIFE